MKFFIFATLITLNSIQTHASCDWYNYNMMGQSSVLESNTKGLETNEAKSYRIMNVQKQAVDYYLALKYSTDSKKLKQAPVTYTSKWNALYCMTMDHSIIFDSANAQIYLGLKSELQKDLFYEFLKQEPALKLLRLNDNEATTVEEIKVVIDEKTLTEFQLEVKLAKYLKNVDKSLADKLKQAIQDKDIDLNSIPSEFESNSQLLEYLYHPQTPRKSPSLAQYFDVVGEYEKPLSRDEELNQYYISTYAYLVYLKERDVLPYQNR